MPVGQLLNSLGKKPTQPKPQWDPKPVFPPLAEFYRVVEVSSGAFFINELFRRKFNDDAPGWARHFVSFYRAPNGAYLPANYLHALPYGETMLIGGGVTDGNVIRNMRPEHRDAITETGGCLFIALRSVFAYLHDDCEAFFGYVNDARAYEVDLKAGFKDTPYAHLVAYFHKNTSKAKNIRLTDEVRRLGPF